MKRSKAYWEHLKAIRNHFLDPQMDFVYWQNSEDLSLYDESFGERIRWKALHIFKELLERAFPSNTCIEILDWGCGSGIFIDAYLESFPEHRPKNVFLYDHSQIALDFALQKLQPKYPHVNFFTGFPDFKTPTLTLISHVLNECSERSLNLLNTIGTQSEAMIWLESGTAKNSKHLGEMRDRLKHSLHIWAPCPHSLTCPLLKAPQDWCHNFALVPQEAFHSAYWEDFSKELGIDRRRLPFTYLALHRNEAPSNRQARPIGEARLYKAWADRLMCHPTGQALNERILKRDQPTLFKKLKKIVR